MLVTLNHSIRGRVTAPWHAHWRMFGRPNKTNRNTRETKRGAGIRASQLIGMNIQNDQGKGVGEVQDLILDSRTGQVRYVAVTYGGFLGFGNKMFAVPYEAFRWKHDPDDRDDYILVLNSWY